MGPINDQLRAISNSSHRRYIRPDLTVKTPGFLKRILWVVAGPFHGLRKAWFGVDYRSTAQNLARYQANVLVDPLLWNPTIKKLQRMNRAFRHLKPIAPLHNPAVNLGGAVLPRAGVVARDCVYDGGGGIGSGLGSPVFSGTLVLPPVSPKSPRYSTPRPSSVPVVQISGRQAASIMPQGQKSAVGTRDTVVADYSGQGGDRLTNTNTKTKRVEDRQKTAASAPAPTLTPAPKPAVHSSLRSVAPPKPVTHSSKSAHTSSVTVHKSSPSSRAPGSNAARVSKGGSGSITLTTGRSTGGSSLILKKS